MSTSSDLSLVIGILFLVLSIPSLLNAWSENRSPRFGGLLCITGLVLIVLAASKQTYTPNEVPDVFLRVFSRFFG